MTGCEIGHSSYTRFPYSSLRNSPPLHVPTPSAALDAMAVGQTWVPQVLDGLHFGPYPYDLPFERDTLLISVAEYRTSNIDTTELPVLLMVAAPHYFLMKTSHYLLKRGDICRPKTPKNTRAHSSQRCFLFPNIYFNRKKHHLTSAFPGFAQCGTITSKASSLWIRHMVVFHVFPLGNLISLSDPCPDTLF